MSTMPRTELATVVGEDGQSQDSPTRKKRLLMSAVAALLLIVGGAAALGLYATGTYGASGPAEAATAPTAAEALTHQGVADALVRANVLMTPALVAAVVNGTGEAPDNTQHVDTMLSDAVQVPSWRAIEDSKGGGASSGATTKTTTTTQGKGGASVEKEKGADKPKTDAGTDEWKDASSGTSAVCYPKNGYEVVKMVNGSASPCRVIVLTKPFTYGYKIERQINVTQPKIIVGNPVAMPMLNCSKKIERCFEVLPGGRLDTRFLIMVRGGGRYLDAGKTMRLSFGTHVRVQVGGDYTATGVVFRERNNTLQTFFEEVENVLEHQGRYTGFNLGQYLAVVGGNLFLQGCFFLRMRPYGTAFINTNSLGREVLVIAGNAVFTGVHNIAYMLFSSYPYVSGKVLCVLGGTTTMIGGSSVYGTGAQMQLGWGIDLTTLGGVLVTIGWQYGAANAALLRVGGGQFGVGGGTVYHTGLNYARVIGAGAFFGAGVTHVNGGGSLTYIGGSYASFVVSTIFAGVGGWVFQGSGSSTFIAVPQSRYAVTHNMYGNGGVFYMGAGILTLILNPQYSAYTAYFQAGAGSDTFLGAGWLTSIRNIRAQFQLVYGQQGIGNVVYVGAGGAIFINTFTYYKRLKYWTNWKYTYTVGGTGFKPKKKKAQTVVITKDQVSVSTNHRYERELQDAAAWLADLVSVEGGLDPYLENKIIMLNTTTYEKGVATKNPDPVFPGGDALSLKQAGPATYGKFLARAALQQTPTATDTGVLPGKVTTRGASCFLCGSKPGLTAEHVDVGGSTCVVAEGCQGTTAQATIDSAQKMTDVNLGFPGKGYMPSAAQPAKLASLDGADEDDDLPDLYFLWYDMVVYCRSTDPYTDDSTIMENCLTAQYVKDIVQAYLSLEPGLGGQGDQGYDLAVSPTAVHGAVKGLLAKDQLGARDDPLLLDLQMATAPEWNPDCQGWTKYEVQLSSKDAPVRARLAKAMDAVVADPTDMSTSIVKNYQDTTTDLQPCSVTVSKKVDTRFPSIKRMPAFQPSARAKVGPDVVVSDGKSIVPADQVVAGQTYKIFVQNFPRGSKINLQLVSSRRQSGPVIATIDDFNDDGTSEVVTWTAPATLDPDTNYYIKASPAAFPSLFANSQLLRSRLRG